MYIFCLDLGEATEGLPGRLDWFQDINQRKCREAIRSAANAEILETEEALT